MPQASETDVAVPSKIRGVMRPKKKPKISYPLGVSLKGVFSITDFMTKIFSKGRVVFFIAG